MKHEPGDGLLMISGERGGLKWEHVFVSTFLLIIHNSRLALLSLLADAPQKNNTCSLLIVSTHQHASRLAAFQETQVSLQKVKGCDDRREHGLSGTVCT